MDHLEIYYQGLEIIQVGKPIPKVWLHMEFDYRDTLKYMRENLVDSEEERHRILNKYFKRSQHSG